MTSKKDENNKTYQVEASSINNISEKRFNFDGKKINGYYAIYDNKNLDNIIWVDSPNNYLPVIVKALNENF